MYEYHLTEMGRDFFPILAAMSRWGDRWLSGDDGPLVAYYHESCGHTHAEVVCAECGEALLATNTSMRMGPGYPQWLAHRPDVKRRFSRKTALTEQP